MVIADNQPKLTDIHSLISQVPHYPISVKGLLEFARQRRINKNVISFYNAFPKNAVFKDKDDIEDRSIVVQILESEDQPLEYTVRGEED